MSLEFLAYCAFFLTVALTYAVIVLGLNVQWGQTGLFNVGVAGFVAVGAYVSALLTSPAVEGRFGGLDLPILVGWLGAFVAAGLLSALIGWMTIRLRADYLAISTFGIAVTVQLAVLNLEDVTGGPFGISLIPRPFGDLAGRSLAFSLANLALLVAVVFGLYLMLQHLAKSPWGRALRAIREDEMAAEALGKSPRRFRIEAFALGGAIMGLGGAAQAHFIGFIAPENYLPMLTFQVWAMLIVGGSGNNRGAILGALLVWALWAASSALVEALAPAGEQARAASLQTVIIGVALCAILLFRPQGLLPEPGGARRRLPFLRRWRGTPAATTGSDRT
ncbi:branched-chain amino acid ABC transporter permease [Stappia sp. WLB 29]|uniref:branched-chain amino acid ABC transporter permease n=1 Tax=Stappia sp. WLB 29 TaxID=2925220 RepID=UPI0020BD9513|nr:branched-chain amino acid ABC transporter permease [Stappia sp. WLB 29]